MVTLGIVGCEEAKFTEKGHLSAVYTIQRLLDIHCPARVVSGGCHLGGVDKWAIREAKRWEIETHEFLPKTQNWTGYKARNILIAEASDIVVCLSVDVLPDGFKAGGWEKYCYHCKTDSHIKSGGCWTVKKAKELGKQGWTTRISNK